MNRIRLSKLNYKFRPHLKKMSKHGGGIWGAFKHWKNMKKLQMIFEVFAQPKVGYSKLKLMTMSEWSVFMKCGLESAQLGLFTLKCCSLVICLNLSNCFKAKLNFSCNVNSMHNLPLLIGNRFPVWVYFGPRKAHCSS